MEIGNAFSKMHRYDKSQLNAEEWLLKMQQQSWLITYLFTFGTFSRLWFNAGLNPSPVVLWLTRHRKATTQSLTPRVSNSSRKHFRVRKNFEQDQAHYQASHLGRWVKGGGGWGDRVEREQTRTPYPYWTTTPEWLILAPCCSRGGWLLSSCSRIFDL